MNELNFYFASLVEDAALELEKGFYPHGYVGEKYTATKDSDLSVLEHKERELLVLIRRKLGGLNATDVAEMSHK